MKRHIKRRPKSRLTLLAGSIMLALLAAAALLAPVISPFDPAEQDLYAILAGPDSVHLLGTDQLGRDLLSRLLYAARTDLSVMLLAEIAPFVTGIFLGMLAGYLGGKTAWIISLVTDVFIAFPFYLLVAVVAFLTGAGSRGIYVTYALVGWLVYARVARGVTHSLAGSEWAQAARMTGYSTGWILIREMLPNVLPQCVVVLMSDMVGLMVIVVTLGYLGIGIQQPVPDWGTMIAEGQAYMAVDWRLTVLPGLMAVYTGTGLACLGDGIAGELNRR